MTRRRRIAWLGPAPSNQGGVSYMAGLLLEAIADLDIDITCFVGAEESDIPPRLLGNPRIVFVCRPSSWEFNKWYSRTPFTMFATGTSSALRNVLRLGAEVVEHHRRHPFDFVYLFNAADVTALRGHLRELPPVVLHPEVHAFGELRWLWNERSFVPNTDGDRLKALAIGAVMGARSASQAVGARRAVRVIAPSRRFADLIESDWKLPPGRITVVPNPIDVHRFTPRRDQDPGEQNGPLRLLFVGRLAVRKGLESVVELSHRLDDLHETVRIEIVGGTSLWSNYTHLTTALNPRLATFSGALPGSQIAGLMRAGDIFLCPSRYEPFGLTVAEALASGLTVVASDAVGAAEDAHCPAVLGYRSGDIDALEQATRKAIENLRVDRDASRLRARAEAERLFAPRVVRERLATALHGL